MTEKDFFRTAGETIDNLHANTGKVLDICESASRLTVCIGGAVTTEAACQLIRLLHFGDIGIDEQIQRHVVCDEGPLRHVVCELHQVSPRHRGSSAAEFIAQTEQLNKCDMTYEIGLRWFLTNPCLALNLSEVDRVHVMPKKPIVLHREPHYLCFLRSRGERNVYLFPYHPDRQLPEAAYLTVSPLTPTPFNR